MTTQDPPAGDLTALAARVVVGVDDSPGSLGAARQAALIQGEWGSLHLVAAADVEKASEAGFSGPELTRQVMAASEYGLKRAGRELPWATTLLVKGSPAHSLLQAAGTYRATLVAVGAAHMGRGGEAMLRGPLLGAGCARRHSTLADAQSHSGRR
jgi:nucleotide-binding universal stress UspA family protein